MVPGGKKLTEQQALALAQGAVAHGLDPFNGEIWYIPGSGLMAGIKGLRKAARIQLKGNFWPEFEQINDPDERNLLLIPEGALAFRCIIRDSETIMAFAEAWKKLAAEDIPSEVIETIIGKRPYTEGVGYLKEGETTRMDPVQVAMKRAEADAMKRRFDLPFAVPSETNGGIIDGEWHEAEQEPEVVHKQAQQASDDLFGSDEKEEPAQSSSERPYPPETVRNRISASVEKYKGTRRSDKMQELAVWQLNECFAVDENQNEKRHSVTAYLFENDSATDLSGAELKSIIQWLDSSEDDKGDFKPSKDARDEAIGIVVTRMKEQGQAEMEL
jgi:hypothetical protein